MLLLSGVFKPSGPEREQDHRRSMANLSVFHRPPLILLICLPFVEAHSQLPEFRIRPCFVTKTAQVIILNGWTKGWPTDECLCGFASRCVVGYQYHAMLVATLMWQPSKNVVLVRAEISGATTLAPCHHAEGLSHASKETADLLICFRIIVGLFHPRRQLSNAVRIHWLSEGNVNNLTLNSQ